MESRIGTFVLRLAATAILFAPAAPAQAQGIGLRSARPLLGNAINPRKGLSEWISICSFAMLVSRP